MKMWRQNNRSIPLFIIVLIGQFIFSWSILNCQVLNPTNSSLCDVCSTGYLRTTIMQLCGKQIINCQFLNDASVYNEYIFSNISYSYQSTSGTSLNLSDDQSISNIPIGFNFYFWGIQYSTVTISMNGWISLGTHPSKIAANDMNLYPSSGFYLNYQTIGSSPNRKFIVSYHVGYYSCQNNFTDFQIVLFQTTNIIRINIASHPGCNEASYQYIQNNDKSKRVDTPNKFGTVWDGTVNFSIQFLPTTNCTCDSCATGYQTTTSLSLCGTIIPNCLFLRDQNTSQCDSCATGYQTTTSLSLCGTIIPNCLFLRDQNTSQCDSCATGYQTTTSLSQCAQSITDCLLLNDVNHIHCDTCSPVTIWKISSLQCFPLHFNGCLYYIKVDGQYLCKVCDRQRKFVLINETLGCKCINGYQIDKELNQCKQICGDGIRIYYECDDNNTLNNDGCNDKCILQAGFQCDTSINPTYCNSTQQLLYRILSIKKSENSQNSAIIVLEPVNKNMPFNVIKDNFYTNKNFLTQLDLIIIIGQFPNQTTLDVQFQLLKIDNNEIYLSFGYNFTVEGLKAQIKLNYSETRYVNRTQLLNFTLKGDYEALKFSQLQQSYNTVSGNFIITILIVILGLLIGLFLPKFIGLQTLITLQLIFYSQLLISDFELWPIGFQQFKNFKIATGYNQFFKFTEYSLFNDLNKKFNKLILNKTIIQNFNLSFIIILVPSLLLYISATLRQSKQIQLKKLSQQKNVNCNFEGKQIVQVEQKCKILNKFNETIYWVSSQLTFWCILPLISAMCCQFMINNKYVKVNENETTDILLKLRIIELIIAFFLIFFNGLSHFKNVFLSSKTNKKINNMPQQLLYKRLLFIYLFCMGLMIFLFNDKKIFGMPISMLCLVIHFIYIIALIKIKPYNNSLKIHSVALYLNQIIYLVFLALLNFINLIGQVDDLIILILGYFVLGCCYLLIILTIFRLYYQIRYGQAIEKKIKQQKLQKQKNKKLIEQAQLERLLQKKAQNKINKAQKERDLNQYLIENQNKQSQKINLLEWLQQKNWQNQTKQKYYFQHFDKKPQKWKKTSKVSSNKKQIGQIQDLRQKQNQKKQKKYQDQQYINVVNRLKKSLEDKRKKKSRKVQRVKETNQQKDFKDQL